MVSLIIILLQWEFVVTTMIFFSIKSGPLLFNYLKIPNCFIGWNISFAKN